MIKQLIPVTDTYSLWKDDGDTYFLLPVEFYALEDDEVKPYSFDCDGFFAEPDISASNFCKLIKSYLKLPIINSLSREELLKYGIEP